MTTAAEHLAEVDAAISACLKSQSYSTAERQLRRAELADMKAFRRELLQEIQESSNGGQMSSVGQINRPI